MKFRPDKTQPPIEPTEPVQGDLSFQGRLENIILHEPYTKEGLAFEFDLSWEELEKLLQEHCEYTENGDQITITRKKKAPEGDQEPESGKLETPELTDENFKALQDMFYDHRREYRNVKKAYWPEAAEGLLHMGLENHLIIYDQQKEIYFLHKLARRRYAKSVRDLRFLQHLR